MASEQLLVVSCEVRVGITEGTEGITSLNGHLMVVSKHSRVVNSNTSSKRLYLPGTRIPPVGGPILLYCVC